MFRWKLLTTNTLRLAMLTAPMGLLGCIPPAGLEEFEDIAGDVATVPTKDGNLQVTSVNPTIGTTDGDRIALVRGSGFVPGMTVMFGEQEAKEVTFVSDTMLTALVPPNQAGAVDVTLAAEVDGVPREVALQNSFTFVLPPEDDGTDTDGDGLTDVQEQIVGWRIRVDMLGLGMNPAHLTRYNVNSDPLNPDTDGDGLSDNAEFYANTNPRSVDTDTDGLWDGEEATRWLTSPISVDSDGDARAADPSTDRSTIPPVFDLFDGLELYTSDELAKDPSQRTLKLNATSPTLDDTDGDGVSDFEEIDTPVRTPLLADTPQLRFEIVDAVDVRLDVEYAEEVGTTTAFETSFETAESSTQSASQSNTVSSSVTVGAELSLFPFDGGGLSTEVTAGREQSWETTQESTVEASQTFSQLEERSRTNTETAASGSITAGVRITNLGNITVQVKDLVHTVRQWLPNSNANATDTTAGSYRTLAALAPDLGPGLTLSPGADSGVLLASDEDVNPDRIRDLLRRPDSLQLQPAAYELVNEEGFNFAFIDEVTQARTARLSVDFGDGRFEEYRVATNVDRNTDASLAGLSLSKALDLTVGAGNWATETVTNPCGPQSLDLIQNGSFESPAVEFSTPDQWTVRTIGQSAGESIPVFAVAGSGTPGLPPAPVGNQWLVVRVDQEDAGPATVRGAHQLLNTASSSFASYDYSFQTRSISVSEFETNYTLTLWEGEPGNGGQVIDSDQYVGGNLNGGDLETISGRLSGFVTPGSQMYIEISTISVYYFPDQLPYYLLIDDFQMFDENAPSEQQITVLSQLRDATYDLNAPRFWSIFVEGQPLADGADFASVSLNAGDAVLLAFQQDADGDGLYASQEQQYGSSDAMADSDGDGLTDAEEAARRFALDFCNQGTGGWNVTVTRRDSLTSTTRVYSDPTRSDADQDGLSDSVEQAGGTNPNSADTDGDGLADNVDPAPTVQAAILHVRPDGPNGDGRTWTTAFSTLQAAFDAATAANSDGTAANDISEVWVAQGEYVPVNELVLPNNVPVYGGFLGSETRLAQRIANGAINGTVITGFVAAIAANNQDTVILDGFFLDGGQSLGAGIVSVNSKSIFRNLLISGYTTGAISIGGVTDGVTDEASFQDCIIANNSRVGGGGGVNLLEAVATFTDCEFTANSAEVSGTTTGGGAILASNAAMLILDGCRLLNNAALGASNANAETLRGGAIQMVDGTISNCEFRGNKISPIGAITNAAWTDTNAGGAIAIFGDVEIINSVFFNNEAIAFGGAIYVGSINGDTGDARVTNSTFSGNRVLTTSSTSTVSGQLVNNFNANNTTPFSVFLQPLAVGAAVGVGGAGGNNANLVATNSIFYGNISNGNQVQTCRQDGVCINPPVLTLELQVSTTPAVRFDWYAQLINDINDSLQILNWPIAARGTIETRNCNIEGLGGEAAFAPYLTIGNLGLDPQFVDAVSGNLRLTSSSPLVDIGNNIVDVSSLSGFQPLPAFDILGKPRVADGNADGNADIDLGAYELEGAN